MTTRVLIINLGPDDIAVDCLNGLDSHRVIKLIPTSYREAYVYQGSDLRITEVRQENEVANTV